MMSRERGKGDEGWGKWFAGMTIGADVPNYQSKSDDRRDNEHKELVKYTSEGWWGASEFVSCLPSRFLRSFHAVIMRSHCFQCLGPSISFSMSVLDLLIMLKTEYPIY